MRLSLLLIPLLALGACATDPGGETARQREMARPEADCQARGGVLVAAGNRAGRTDSGFVCNNPDATRIAR